MAASDDPRGKPAPDAGAKRRKPYAAPRLKSYGSVAKLTQGTSSVGTDFGTMTKRTMCL